MGSGRIALVLAACLLARPPIEAAAHPVCGAAAGCGPAADDSAAACGECHRAVHAEWQDSAHARAWTDAVYQRQLARRREPERCTPCHVPGPVLARLGAMPQPRTERREEGVTCAACHVHDGAVHGPNGATLAAGAPEPIHPLQKDATFGKRGSFVLCSSCHDMAIADVLPLAREFRAAGLQDQDLSCIGCHMETTRRAPANDADGQPVGAVRGGRSHRLLGPADKDFCASAFEVEVVRRDGRLVAEISTGAGHGVPGLARLRTFPMRLLLLDATGSEIARRELLISWRDRLLVDEVRRIELPQSDRAVALRIVVDHVFAGETLATVVDRTLDLP